MPFGKAMESMGGKTKLKPSKAPDEEKGKSKPAEKGKVEGESGDGPGDAHSEIHSHLQSMHEKTGNAHSHVEHHFDGHHTSHHISEHGEISGPHEHGSTDEVKQGMDQMLGGGMNDGDADDQQMPPQAPQHAMGGF